MRNESEPRVSEGLWWHLYFGYNHDMEGFAELVMGESTMGPKRLQEDPARLDIQGTRYVCSFDHEPDDDDKNRAVIEFLWNDNEVLQRLKFTAEQVCLIADQHSEADVQRGVYDPALNVAIVALYEALQAEPRKVLSDGE